MAMSEDQVAATGAGESSEPVPVLFDKEDTFYSQFRRARSETDFRSGYENPVGIRLAERSDTSIRLVETWDAARNNLTKGGHQHGPPSARHRMAQEDGMVDGLGSQSRCPVGQEAARVGHGRVPSRG